MPDLLLEFFSEEIPARMQARAAEDLKKLVTDRLVAAGLTYEGAKGFATPRRLALVVHGIPARQPDVKEERKGPRVGAPEGAIAGFLKAAGLKSISEAKIEQDAKKGDFYVALIEKPGRPAIKVIADVVREVANTFPWPKSMLWGDAKMFPDRDEKDGKIEASTGDSATKHYPRWVRWVRPLHSVLATFGPETEEPEIIRFRVGEINSGNITFGHRFMAPAQIEVRRFDDYVKKLEKAKVILDAARRAEIIRADAKNLAFAQGLDVVADEGLLAEVSGLVEWPVVLMGSFDEAFLEIPDEVIRATIRNNQKCFVLRDPQTAKLVNKFIMVANIETADGGKAIVAGCERVIRARLSDAKFFYETDLKTRLEARLPKFKDIVFHEKLGTQADRIERISRLAKELAPIVKADPRKAELAALLCKTDLLTEVVGEFPELQGVMGKYYAEAQGEDEAVAHACEDHYSPKGPDDLVPADPVSVTVALADKIDILVGFWAIDEKPTGSKDPYALRRAALGVIRLVLENKLRVSLLAIIRRAVRIAASNEIGLLGKIASFDGSPSEQREFLEFHRIPFMRGFSGATGVTSQISGHPSFFKFVWFYPELFHEVASKFPIWGKEYKPPEKDNELLSFFADRLKVQLREQGARHDLVDAVFALEGQDDLLMIVRRVEALGKFLDTDDGKNLLAGYKRATNIIRIEEKKDKRDYTGAPDAKLYAQAEEKELARAIGVATAEAGKAVAAEDFAAAMRAIAVLRPHVDAFFDKVTVNVDDKPLRENRLKLLNEIRQATRAVADFSKIEG